MENMFTRCACLHGKDARDFSAAERDAPAIRAHAQRPVVVPELRLALDRQKVAAVLEIGLKVGNGRLHVLQRAAPVLTSTSVLGRSMASRTVAKSGVVSRGVQATCVSRVRVRVGFG